MVTIIHGSDITASRNFFHSIKSQTQNSVTINGATVTQSDLVQILQGDGLFESDQRIFIDEFFSKRKPSKDLDSLISLISQTSQTVVIWESKDLTAKQLGNFKKADIKQFKLPAVLFSYLDSIKPGNGAQMVNLFHQTIVNQPDELVFFMLVRHIRTLLALNCHSGEQSDSRIKEGSWTSQDKISELSRLAPWQKVKLEKQASLFTQGQLLSFYQELYKLEYGQKTGNLSQPLSASLDFLLLKL